MTTRYQDFLSSPPFLVQGPNGRSFHVHSALLAAHSNVLDMDVHSGMRESSDRVIRIMDIDGDIDDDTVTQFIEYAYTGRFTVPIPASLLIDPAEHPPNTTTDTDAITATTTNGIHTFQRPKSMRRPDEFAWIGPGLNHLNPSFPFPIPDNDRTQFKLLVQERRATLWSSFTSHRHHRHRQTVDNPRRQLTLLTRTHKDDLAKFLIAHARLYVFSLRYGCGGLATAALQQLRGVLSGVDPGDAVVAVLRLVEFVYANTHAYSGAAGGDGNNGSVRSEGDVAGGSGGDNGSGGGCDRLRRLVLDCLVCCLEEAEGQAAFWDLLERDEQIAEDLDCKLVELCVGERAVLAS